MLLPVLASLAGALGGILSGLGAWIVRRAHRHEQARELIITIDAPDGSTDELRVREEDHVSAQQAAAWLRPTLEEHVSTPIGPHGSPV